MSGWGRVAAGCCVLIALLLLLAFLTDLPPFSAEPDSSAEGLIGGDEEAHPAPADEARARPRPSSPSGHEPELKEVRPGPPSPRKPDVVETPPAQPEDGSPPPAVVSARTPAISGKEIAKALNKGLSFLRKKQARNGSWGSVQGSERYGADRAGYPAGPTALVLYTLLKARQPLKDPVVKRGFEFLYRTLQRPRSSCETSMLLLAVSATAENDRVGRSASKARRLKLTGRYRKWATRLVDHLVGKRSARGWRYNDPEHPTLLGGAQDLSSTQLAALALLSARRVGVKVKDQVWEDILRFTLEQQELDGPAAEFTHPSIPAVQASARARGFTYVKLVDVPDRGAPTGGMTACGVANLLMARYVLSDSGRRKREWSRREDATAVGVAIVDGLAWLDAHWSPFDDPGKGEVQFNHVYRLWMLECAMDLAGLKKLGDHSWYAEAGAELLRRQRPDGSWVTKGSWQPADTLDTAFALLFLKRASRGLIEDE